MNIQLATSDISILQGGRIGGTSPGFNQRNQMRTNRGGGGRGMYFLKTNF